MAVTALFVLFSILSLAQSPVMAAQTYTWLQQSPATSPPVRDQATMGYDPSTGNVVMFSGYDGTSSISYNDTWLYNGTTWKQVADAGDPGCTNTCTNSPPAVDGEAYAFDTATSQFIIFGGYNGSIPYNDTWAFSMATDTWSQTVNAGCTSSCTGSPPIRQFGMAAFDSATSQVILFGGYSSTTLSDTWAYDGATATWTQETPATSPAARYAGNMAYDAASSQVILFGGYNGSVKFNDTWAFSPSSDTWTQVADSGDAGCTSTCTASPPGRTLGGMAYDPATTEILLFGGFSSSLALNDTWGYNASTSTWTQYSLPAGCTNTCVNSPPPTNEPGMAFDGAISAGVLFAGIVSSAPSNGTWIFNYAQTSSVTVAPAAGTLAFVSVPSSVAFSGLTLSGVNQTSTASLPLDIGDATGSGNGWNVTLSATTFTNAAGDTLAYSDFSVLSTSPPTVACDTNSTCTVATLGSLYPYTLSATATKLLSSAAGTGMGDQTVTIPWSASIPANAYAGTYTSTWTFTLVSGP